VSDVAQLPASTTGEERLGRRLTTPRAAAVAGLLFALLFATALILVRTALPDDSSATAASAQRAAGQLTLAVTLIPFAGIAFLWFVGVVRDRLGELEDRFFSSVMFGSAVLFLAMLFVAMAIAGGIVVGASGDVDEVERKILTFGREVMLQISNVYALRMAGVFMISLATIWLRTGIMPRWVVAITYLVALMLLVVVTLSVWVTLVFPAWVCVISILILLASFRRRHPT
jgi:hypothetical protein